MIMNNEQKLLVYGSLAHLFEISAYSDDIISKIVEYAKSKYAMDINAIAIVDVPDNIKSDIIAYGANELAAEQVRRLFG